MRGAEKSTESTEKVLLRTGLEPNWRVSFVRKNYPAFRVHFLAHLRPRGAPKHRVATRAGPEVYASHLLHVPARLPKWRDAAGMIHGVLAGVVCGERFLEIAVVPVEQ